VWGVDRAAACVYRSLLAPRRVGPGGVLSGEDVVPGLAIAVDDLLAR